MDSNHNMKTADSLYKLLEQMKAQNETAKRNLYRHLETELDRTFNQMVTSLVTWAIKNIPDSSSRITDMLSLLESTEERRQPESTNERPSVNAPQRENVSEIEPAALSQEIIQLSDESIFNASDDEEEVCSCKECSKRKRNFQSETEEIQIKTENCDESSQLSNVTHISDSQPQLDFDEIVEIKQELEASQNGSPVSATNQLNQELFTFPESSESTRSTEQPFKRMGNKIQFISLKCQNKACKETFLNREALQHHMQNKHHVLPYMCFQRRCKASFTTQHELNEHLGQVHSNQSSFQCALCLKVFKDHSCLAHHSNQYHLEGVIACAFPRCNWTGSVRSEAMKHFRQSHIQFTCDYPNCGKSFAYKHVYSLHVKCHSDLRPYQCSLCHYASNNYSSVIRHTRNVHLKGEMVADDLRNPKDYVRVLKSVGVAADKNKSTTSTTSSTTTITPSSSSVTGGHSPLRKANRVYQCKWSGCSYSSLSRLKIHVHVNEVHSRHKTVMVKHSTPLFN